MENRRPCRSAPSDAAFRENRHRRGYRTGSTTTVKARSNAAIIHPRFAAWYASESPRLAHALFQPGGTNIPLAPTRILGLANGRRSQVQSQSVRCSLAPENGVHFSENFIRTLLDRENSGRAFLSRSDLPDMDRTQFGPSSIAVRSRSR